MDKNSIKKYAVWARRELISRVTKKALQYGITEKEIIDASADIIGGHVLSASEKKQRQNLIDRINSFEKDGFQLAMEEAAYTWFNRFSALRFMEVNGYLPTHVRVFTDEQNAFKPQILAEAIHLELDGLNMEKVYELKDANKTDELYKYLLITQCNALSKILPGMFTRIADYTELLFPDNLLREDSVIEQMISQIAEDDWKDAVQIIGWLYESYNIEKNELVYDGNMSKSRIPKELLPAATTIFTPDWPIRYMVENSLGRLWVEGHPNDELKANWKYYLEDAEQEPEVQIQLAELRREYAELRPEDIKVIDPCMGSGHILVYMFDVLMQIYESYGYNAREAAGLILQNNLYGLDIDDRAAQLAYFAVMMKARQYDRRIFSRGIQPHVYAIVESNGISNDILTYFENGNDNLKNAMKTIVCELHDAKEYGSILNVTSVNFAALYTRLDEIKEDISFFAAVAQSELRPIIEVAQILTQKYHVIVTNPPYLGNSRFSLPLDKYVKENYSDVKSDLSMVMYKHVLSDMVASSGYVAFITTSSWMFLSGFEKLRDYQRKVSTINTIVDFGTELFDGKVGHNPIVAWVTQKGVNDYKMTAIRLVDYCYSRRDEKEAEFFQARNRYFAQQDDFTKIPGSPVAYWVGDSVYNAFVSLKKLGEIGETKTGMTTGDNNRFLRLWFEINNRSIGHSFEFYSKGSDFRRWYCSVSNVILWKDNGKEVKDFKGSTIRNEESYFKKCLVWNLITSGTFSARAVFRHKCVMGDASPAAHVNEEDYYYVLACLNTKPVQEFLKIINPTINCSSGVLSLIPIAETDQNQKERVNYLSEECVKLSIEDWDFFETSWDFKRHPLVTVRNDLAFGQFAEARREKIASQLREYYREWES